MPAFDKTLAQREAQELHRFLHAAELRHRRTGRHRGLLHRLHRRRPGHRPVHQQEDPAAQTDQVEKEREREGEKEREGKRKGGNLNQTSSSRGVDIPG